MNCRLPKKIGTPGEGASGLAFVITDETGTLNASSFYLTINGTKYYTAQTVEVSEGTVVKVTATKALGIYENGTQIQYFGSGGSYDYTITKNTTFSTYGSSGYGVFAEFLTE